MNFIENKGKDGVDWLQKESPELINVTVDEVLGPIRR